MSVNGTTQPDARPDSADGNTARGTANARQDYRSAKGGVDLASSSAYPDQSAKHADQSVSALIKAATTTDTRERDHETRVAGVLATLSLRDKVDELVAVLKQQARQ